MDLPPEIIEIILLEFSSSKTIFPLQGRDQRLILTQVCSRWRAIALAIPSLWANIRISLDSPPLLDPIRTWIYRSAQSPLSFGIRSPSNYNTSSTAIVDLVFPITQRCTFLKLYIDESTFTRFLSLPPGSLHALQEISIKPIPVPYPTILGVIPRTTAFQQCPHLRKVTFAFAAHAVDLADFNLPWHQLTHLDVHSCSLREYECLNVLRQCTALEECSISTFSTPARDLYKIAILSRNPVVLPSLLSLSLNLGDLVGYSVHFVYALRLPRLRSLRPSSQVSLYRALLPAFWKLLSETIRHLDFPDWIPIDLPGALALVPNLETLELQDSDSGVLEALSGGAVPHLVTLRLGIVNSCDLFDMLEARTAATHAGGGVAALSDVSAIDSGTMDMDRTRLYALRAAGVQVVFRNWSL